jgi:hypothetical protein
MVAGEVLFNRLQTFVMNSVGSFGDALKSGLPHRHDPACREELPEDEAKN